VTRAFADAADEDFEFELFFVIRRVDGSAGSAALQWTCNQLVVDIREDAGHPGVVSRKAGGSRRCAASEVSGGSSVSKRAPARFESKLWQYGRHEFGRLSRREKEQGARSQLMVCLMAEAKI
jgi:hypothetical protein